MGFEQFACSQGCPRSLSSASALGSSAKLTTISNIQVMCGSKTRKVMGSLKSVTFSSLRPGSGLWWPLCTILVPPALGGANRRCCHRFPTKLPSTNNFTMKCGFETRKTMRLLTCEIFPLPTCPGHGFQLLSQEPVTSASMDSRPSCTVPTFSNLALR